VKANVSLLVFNINTLTFFVRFFYIGHASLFVWLSFFASSAEPTGFFRFSSVFFFASGDALASSPPAMGQRSRRRPTHRLSLLSSSVD
jgi:hypothetical protein